jgi:hypothetical protein
MLGAMREHFAVFRLAATVLSERCLQTGAAPRELLQRHRSARAAHPTDKSCDGVTTTRSLMPGPGVPVRIKGTSILDAVEAARKREGEQRMAQIMESLPPRLRQVFDNGILPTSYYSLDAFVAFLEAGFRLGGDDERILIKRTEAVVERQLTGLYRVFIKLGSPEFVVRRITTIHQTYFTGIGIDVELRDGDARIRYTGFRAQHRLIEYVLIGFYQKALQICGARDVRAQVSVPLADDPPFCEVHVTWQR